MAEDYYQDYTANARQYQAPPPAGGSGRANGMQIASLILGILGMPACCCYGVVGLLMGIAGLVLAVAGNKRNRGSGIGIAGFVCSIIAIVFGIAATIYYIIVVLGMLGEGPLADLLREMNYSYPLRHE